MRSRSTQPIWVSVMNWARACGVVQPATISPLIEQDKRHVGARVRMGKIYVMANVLPKALELVEQAITLDAKNADAYALRGAIRARKGDAEGAREDGEMGLKLDRGHTASIALLTSFYHRQKQTDKAIALLDQGIEKNPKESDLRTIKAGILFGQGKTAETARLFEENIALFPTNFAHRRSLASVYVSVKDFDRAERVLRDAIASDPTSSAYIGALVEFLVTYRDTISKVSLIRVRRNSGRVFQNSSKPSKSAQRAPLPLTLLVRSYLALDKAEGARAYLQKFVAADPQNAVAYNLLGETLIVQKKWDEAAGAFRKDTAFEFCGCPIKVVAAQMDRG